MQTAKKPTVKKIGRGTSLAERQEAMRVRASKALRIVRANQGKAYESLRIKLHRMGQALPSVVRIYLQYVPYRTVAVNLRSCAVQSSRDDRIRHLCAKAVATTEPDEVDAALAELRAELHAHIEELRTQMVEMPLFFRQNDAAD